MKKILCYKRTQKVRSLYSKFEVKYKYSEVLKTKCLIQFKCSFWTPDSYLAVSCSLSQEVNSVSCMAHSCTLFAQRLQVIQTEHRQTLSMFLTPLRRVNRPGRRGEAFCLCSSEGSAAHGGAAGGQSLRIWSHLGLSQNVQLAYSSLDVWHRLMLYLCTDLLTHSFSNLKLSQHAYTRRCHKSLCSVSLTSQLSDL